MKKLQCPPFKVDFVLKYQKFFTNAEWFLVTLEKADEKEKTGYEKEKEVSDRHNKDRML